MSTQSIACSACGAAVPYGRLSCPACGELLASVAGGGRRVVAGAAAGGRTVRSLEPSATAVAEPDPEPDVDVELEVAAADADEGADLDDDASPGADEAPVAADAEDDGGLPRWSEPTSSLPASTMEAAPDEADRPVPSVLHDAAQPLPEPTLDWSDDEPPPPTTLAPSAGLAAAYATASPPAMTAAGAAAVATPGAYVPPAPTPLPAGPAAPARAWGDGHGEAGAATVAAAASAGKTDGQASLADDARLREATGWLAVGGAAIAAAGFVLPWATVLIGAEGLGYFDRWGLAGPGHLLAVIALLAIVGANLITNRVPAWIRIGLVGLGVGPLLLGLAWPYLFSKFLGTQVGVYAVAIGAVLLTIAGILALVGDRHGTDTRAV